MSIKVNPEICTGCGSCVDACPFGAIEILNDLATIGDICNLCGACVDACDFEAIIIAKIEKKAETVDNYRGVWVFAEQKNGEICGVAYELLGEGRKLADTLGVDLSAIIFGNGIEPLSRELINYGADLVYLVDDPALKDFHDLAYTAAMVELIEENKPEILLAGATSIGRSFIPRVAARLETGLTADCTGLEIDSSKRILLQTRPAFGGNIMATISCPDRRPQMATVRPKVMKKAQRNENSTGEAIIKTIKNFKKDSGLRVLETKEANEQTVNLAEAEIIVSGGRGLGDPKNFKLMEELAVTLGGAVGASRATVDAGWISYSHQVGQTGRTVCPKIYIACGISGAVQHLVGMQSSDIIVAINSDNDAPIFDVATFGIVGNLFEVVPSLVRAFKEKMGE